MKRKICLTILILIAVTSINLYVHADTVDYSYSEETKCLTIYNSQDYTYFNLPEYLTQDVTKVIISDNITKIGDFAFYKFSNLESVELPDTVQTIGRYAFYNCVSLSDIDLTNIQYIEKYAFYGCTLLYDINTSATLKAHALDIEGDSQYAYGMSLARLDSALDYLNEVYLDDNCKLALDNDYLSDTDEAVIKSAADIITTDCTTDAEKCIAIYNWVKANIKYNYFTESYSAIDVLKNKEGLCSGNAHLVAALMRAENIKCAICRGYKENTQAKTLEFSYTKGYKYNHEWVMAYYDNEWHLYDTLHDNCGTTDKEYNAKWYFLVHVDGIIPYTAEGFDRIRDGFEVTETCYINGDYIGYEYDELTKHGYASLSMGGCLTYAKNYTDGYAYEGGVAEGGKHSEIYIYKDNGITDTASYIKHDNQRYVTSNRSAIKIDDTFIDSGFTNNYCNVYVGQTIDFNNFYNDFIIKSKDENIATINNNILTVVGTGKCEITLRTEDYSKYIVFIIYAQDLNDLNNEYISEVCPHLHLTKNSQCTYCGKVIEALTLVTEEPAIEISTEPNIVTEDLAEAVTLEETAEPVIIETKESISSEPLVEPVVSTSASYSSKVPIAYYTVTSKSDLPTQEMAMSPTTKNDVTEEITTEETATKKLVPQILSIKAKKVKTKLGKTGIKISYTTNINADKYIIYRYNKKLHKYIKFFTTTKKSYINTKNVNIKNKYTYKINAYQAIKGKYILVDSVKVKYKGAA